MGIFIIVLLFVGAFSYHALTRGARLSPVVETVVDTLKIVETDTVFMSYTDTIITIDDDEGECRNFVINRSSWTCR